MIYELKIKATVEVEEKKEETNDTDSWWIQEYYNLLEEKREKFNKELDDFLKEYKEKHQIRVCDLDGDLAKEIGNFHNHGDGSNIARWIYCAIFLVGGVTLFLAKTFGIGFFV
jgi:hypothetical protein